MKIFQFISYTTECNYFRNLVKGLLDRGIEVCCGTLFTTGHVHPEWIKNYPKAKYYCLEASSKRDFLHAVMRLVSILRQENIDILHTHLYEASFVALIAARICRIPVKVMSRHHSDLVKMVGNKLPILMDRWQVKLSDKVIVPSKAAYAFIVNIEKAERKKIELIYYGFDFDKFTASKNDRILFRRELGFNDDDFIIGVIGNFYSTKGHNYLIEAAKMLIPDIPKLELLFIGDGGDRCTLETQIKKEGLEGKVLFTGFRNDINLCIMAVDAIIHPSLSESFCQVIIETMSIGTLIVSTNVGGAPEVIENEKNGLLIPPRDSDAIVEIIRKVYHNPEWAAKIAAAGPGSVRKRFTIDQMVARHINCYLTWIQNEA